MDQVKIFEKEKNERINRQGESVVLRDASVHFINESIKTGYSYNFSWMGRPIIQYPQDMIAMQELIWEIKPDLIIETGVAHGGSIIFYASLLELLGEGKVLGIDIDIREHNRKEIENHTMSKRINLIQGSPISNEVVDQVAEFAKGKERIMVCLDSNHTDDHVFRELELYNKFVSRNSYLVVFDTIVENLPSELVTDRPWSRGNNPMTAVTRFLKTNGNFAIDKAINNKLLISVAPDGYLKKIS